jgi:hypothetical protein
MNALSSLPAFTQTAFNEEFAGINTMSVSTSTVAFSTRAAVTPNPVPEPSEWIAMGMVGTSVMGLMIRARARRRKTSR